MSTPPHDPGDPADHWEHAHSGDDVHSRDDLRSRDDADGWEHADRPSHDGWRETARPGGSGWRDLAGGLRRSLRGPDDDDPDRPVRSYMWPSLVATLLCCLPTGAIALVHATIAQNRLQTGDLVGARQSAGRARRWCVVSVIMFVVVLLLYVTAIVIAVVVARKQNG